MAGLRIAHVNHVALLEEVAAVADREDLHLAVARLTGREMGQYFHIADVHATVEIGDAVRTGMTVMVGQRPERSGSQGQTGASGGFQEIAARPVPAIPRLGLGGFRKCFLGTNGFPAFHGWLLGLGMGKMMSGGELLWDFELSLCRRRKPRRKRQSSKAET